MLALKLTAPKEKDDAEGVTGPDPAAATGGALPKAGGKVNPAAPLRLVGRLESLADPVAFEVDGMNEKLATPGAEAKGAEGGATTAGAASTFEGAVREAEEGGVFPRVRARTV